LKDNNAQLDKKRLKIGSQKTYQENDNNELYLVCSVINISYLGLWQSSNLLSAVFYIFIGNFVLLYTLHLRALRINKVNDQLKLKHATTGSVVVTEPAKSPVEEQQQQLIQKEPKIQANTKATKPVAGTP
jgi:hypothetical protein